MGTLTNTRRMAAKLRGYLIHGWAVKTPVLWVAPDPARLHTLLRWAEEQAAAIGKSPRIFLMTTSDRVSEQTIFLLPIWQKAGVADPVALIPSSAVTAISVLPVQDDESIFQGV